MKTAVYDVLVIGGGISGLYASLLCIQSGASVCTLEKNDRWGGRIHTIYRDNDHFEAGAARFHKHHKYIQKLIKKYQIETVPLDIRPRKFRSRICDKAPINSPATTFIHKVIEASKKYSANFLRSITFGEFAEIILGVADKAVTQNAFGYDGEFDKINAYDGVAMFAQDFATNDIYYACKYGMNTLTDAIIKDLSSSPKWYGLLEHPVIDINTQHDKKLHAVSIVKADGTKEIKKARIIILALPKQALLDIPIWNSQQLQYIQSVEEIALERIYAKYKTPWFSKTHITTTDIPIRQFIPISDHIAMVSYSDTKQADEWNTIALSGGNLLQKKITRELKTLFPDKKIPTKPIWIEQYYWSAGVHMWKTNINSFEYRKHIQQKLWDNTDTFFVCGEAYSKHQCWVDGALETVEEVMPIIRKKLKQYKEIKQLSGGAGGAGGAGGTGGSWIDWVNNKKKNGKLTRSDLKELRSLYPEAKWVLFQKKLINITQWYYSHPGGQTPFDNHMYTDVYPFFKHISHHYNNNQIKDEVMEKINQLTIAEIT